MNTIMSFDVLDADLVENSRKVMAYGYVGNGQPVCNAFVGEALSN